MKKLVTAAVAAALIGTPLLAAAPAAVAAPATGSASDPLLYLRLCTGLGPFISLSSAGPSGWMVVPGLCGP